MLKPVILGKTVEYKGAYIICQNVREMFQYFLIYKGEYRSWHFIVKDAKFMTDKQLRSGYAKLRQVAESTVDTLIAMELNNSEMLTEGKDKAKKIVDVVESLDKKE